jgi:hypothetical protein
MTHDRLANIAVAVTAAMLATATVSFAVSGGGATDPVAEDLPVVLTVPAPTVPHVRSAQYPEPSGAPVGDQTFAMASAGPETFSPTPPGAPAGSATTALSGVASSGPVASPDKKGTVSEHEGDEDEHEVVKPKVRETKPPEDAEDPEDKPKSPEPVEEEH